MTSFSCKTFTEVRTGGGQLLQATVACPSGFDKASKEEQRHRLTAALAEVHHFSEPLTREVEPCNVQHGGYNMYSRFELKQHEYAGGQGGFAEALEILVPLDSRCPYVLHDYKMGHHYFQEYETLADLLGAWKAGLWWKEEDALKGQKGFKRLVQCGIMKPWFYAVGEQRIVGDFVWPENFRETPSFRHGQQYVVDHRSVHGGPDVKTCIHVHEETKEHSSSWERGKTYTVTTVYWSDGTWTRYDGNNIRPLEAGERWIAEAIEEFRNLLAGGKKQFQIPFDDGGRVTVKYDPPSLGKKGRKDKKGRYWVKVVAEKDGETIVKEGNVRFDPSQDKETHVAKKVANELKKRGMRLKKITKIFRRVGRGNNVSWRGVWPNPYADREEAEMENQEGQTL